MKALILSEIKQRIRGKRWWILLSLWVVVLAGVTLLARISAKAQLRSFGQFGEDVGGVPIGPTMFGFLMLFTLSLICLVVPSLSSTSVNSERDRGTLAVLQATMLRPFEIFLAKFASSMLVALAFLAASIPMVLWTMLEGGVGFGRVVMVYVVLVLVCAVLLSVGLATSAWLRRPALSAVMSYAVVFFLTIGTLILFGVAVITAPIEVVEYREGEFGYESEERVIGWRWVILAPNPFVVLADAAPRSNSRFVPDPLEAVRDSVRQSRRPPGVPRGFVRPEVEPPALWPAGLSIELVIALAAGYFTVSRLRIPAGKLAPGQRVA
ncbi:MAG: ABC transporter permease [Actinomycetota bacterium]